MVGQKFVQSEFVIRSSSTEYKITSELDSFIENGSIFLYIVDKRVISQAKKIFSNIEYLIELDVDENLKTLAGCSQILESMAELGINRSFEIIAIGGGALQDAVTLVASIFMRGLKWSYVPTTLMSMLDSCIGGKSSINLGSYKNLLGNFYPPKAIYIDTTFIETLGAIDIGAGLAEGVKICFAASPKDSNTFCELIETWRKLEDPNIILEAILFTLQKKKWFIEIDEFDKKERKLLNFGHSFGHALEAASDFKIQHGIGVFIGMIAAIEHSGISRTSVDRLLRFIETEMQRVTSIIEPAVISKSLFTKAISQDKKNSKTEQVLVLPNVDGILEIRRIPLTSDGLENCWKSLLVALDEVDFAYEIF